MLERITESSWTHRLTISIATSLAPGLGTQRGSSNCTNTIGEEQGKRRSGGRVEGEGGRGGGVLGAHKRR